jgi:GNAT superfamily N-acetyltransferase
MVEVIPVTELARLDAYGADAALPHFDLILCAKQQADVHAIAVRDGKICARASLWWTSVPQVPGQRVSVVGHYASVDDTAAAELLACCADELRARGRTLAVGPMDGNTWRRYRFVTERGAEPPFLMEPDNPETYPAQWTRAGFTPHATYFSALADDLTRDDPQVTRAWQRLQERGVRIRTIDSAHFEEELRRIYALSTRSFVSNFLYTPISEAEFMAQYSAIRERVIPELVLMAELNGELLGYLFAVPNWIEASRGRVSTVIVKTVAVLPERRCAGLGTVLVQEAHRVARERGFTRAIHALMHESNNSLNLSARYAEPFRRYALYSKPL